MLLITIIKYNFAKTWTKFSQKKGQLSLTFLSESLYCQLSEN